MTQDRTVLPEGLDREAIDAWLRANCGNGLPYGEAYDQASMLHGLAYVLRQIESTDSYKVNIGQCTSATSALRMALDHFAAAALRSIPPDDGWKTIDSAPHDTRVLIFVPRSENIKNLPVGTEYIAYKTHPEPPFAQTWRYATGPGKGEQAPWPTHWRPLPPPPEAV